MQVEHKRDLFIKINKAVTTCSQCRLCRGRLNAVPGEGNISAQIVFVGEAPGAEEDKMGRPFVGKSGMLLNELIRKTGFNRRQVWIGNMVKCRPPENRDPMVDEIRACVPYLNRQIALIKPRVIVTLGRVAMEYYLPGKKISDEHGHPYRVKNSIVFPVYHPSAALRNPTIKNILIEDFSKIPLLLNKEINTVPFFEGKNKKGTDDRISLF